LKKYPPEKLWNLANRLTMIRILVIPVIVCLLFFTGRTASIAAALLYVLASLTDIVDGYLARKMGIVTHLGRFLDPMADKLLMTSALIMLIGLHRAPAWMVTIIIGREIAVTGLRGIAATEGIIISASKLGKYKTLSQTVAIVLLILHYSLFSLPVHQLGMIFLWIALIMTVWSGIDYFVRFFKEAFSPNPHS